MKKQTNYARSIFLVLVLVSLLAFAAILKLTASFCIPITVATMLSFVFYPICNKLKKLHVPWTISIFLCIAVVLILFYFIGTLLISSTKTILSTYPKYEDRFTAIYKIFAQTFKISFDEDLSLFNNLWNSLNVRTMVQNFAITFSSSLVSFSKTVFVVLLFLVFLLFEFESLKTKTSLAFSDEDTSLKIMNIARNTVTEVTHFLSIKFMISLLTGLLVFVGTFVIDMDFPIIWGFIAFLLNFIPTFGSAISCSGTILFAILQFYPNWGHIIFVTILVLSVNLILGNIIEPRWEGTDLGISPFIILVSLSFWGWMWGFVGMVLAVPLMVIIKIICENIDILRPVAILMGTKKRTN
ncbi:MAG: AI-2E family transporter [Treponema sp.]|nr:AI-2E family transporter [Treponema sp.]